MDQTFLPYLGSILVLLITKAVENHYSRQQRALIEKETDSKIKDTETRINESLINQVNDLQNQLRTLWNSYKELQRVSEQEIGELNKRLTRSQEVMTIIGLENQNLKKHNARLEEQNHQLAIRVAELEAEVAHLRQQIDGAQP